VNSNLTNDGFHTYTYDAEGNIMTVDGGSTASYIYDALNHRGRTIVDGEPTEFVYNVVGQRATTYVGFAGTVTGQYYWGGKPVAFYKGGSLHFQHQDWMGTEHMRTTYSGASEGQFTSLPFGDGLTTTSGTDTDAYHFAQVDHDYETDTEHAQFRQYSSAQGRWLSPDPYGGSYDPSNPQSFNRYAYALNNPLSNVDPSGRECVWDDGSFDAADDPDTGTATGCATAGGTYVPPDIFESVEGTNPGDWSSNASSTIASDWTTPSVTVNAQNTSSSSILHLLLCSAYSDLLGVAKLTNSTVGEGVGGSVGAGLKSQGFAISLSVQVVADPQGNLGIAGTFGAVTPFSGVVIGTGAVGGVQASVSNAQNVSQLGGPAVDANFSSGLGLGGGIDASAGLATNSQGQLTGFTGIGTLTATGPFAIGGKGGAGMVTQTGVASTNCQ
jgi:RHS repeat-associated protein